MEAWLNTVFLGPSVAHTVFILAIVIASGLALSRIKIKGISLGMTWILFTGIAAGHLLGMFDASDAIHHDTLHFVKEFGLILFVFFIGLQVGPSFFSSLKGGGLKLIGLAALVIFLGACVTLAIHYITGEPLPTMVGIMSGAVTNTPGLGAAQQAFADANIGDQALADSISLGYAVAYPLGVVGIIATIIIMRYVLRVDFKKEDEALKALSNEANLPHRYSVEFTNEMLAGKTIAIAHMLINRQFVVSRIMHASGEIVMADGNSQLTIGDKLRVICSEEDSEAILAFFGHPVEMTADEWGATAMQSTPLVSRRILITREDINGKKFSDLRLRTRYGINITRVHRAGVDLLPYQGMELQVGDKVMVVGPEAAVAQAEKVLGNSLKKLDHPNLLPMFIGIALGILLGSMPLMNIPQPVKLGLAGGPLIIAILLGRFGPHFKMVTYTTMSANLMLRQLGLTIYLAGLGLSAGAGFFETVFTLQGLKWVAISIALCVIPVLLIGFICAKVFKISYADNVGMLCGGMANPFALDYAGNGDDGDDPAVAYATVYPAGIFLRVISAQTIILLLG